MRLKRVRCGEIVKALVDGHARGWNAKAILADGIRVDDRTDRQFPVARFIKNFAKAMNNQRRNLCRLR